MCRPTSGQAPFVFAHVDDLSRVPAAAQPYEAGLHGGFAVDKRPGHGELYYGMAGVGLLRIRADLAGQDVLNLPDDLRGINFHSTKLGEFDGKLRLFAPANNDAFVAVLTLDGEVDFILSKPEFAEYQAATAVFRPTDTALVGDELWIADGYGANHIITADPARRQWRGLFGGKTGDPQAVGRFGTAHGLNITPYQHIAITDRPHSRVAYLTSGGAWVGTHSLPAGSKPCGIDYCRVGEQDVAVIGSLDDPTPGRPAPIYIVDATTGAVLSTIRPKEELGVALADHIHNVVWHEDGGRRFLVCQSWNPGHYFVLEQI